jgi:hypothetical protein
MLSKFSFETSQPMTGIAHEGSSKRKVNGWVLVPLSTIPDGLRMAVLSLERTHGGIRIN